MRTKRIYSLPKELRKKKILRIKEAKKFDRRHGLKINHIDTVNGLDAFFITPGSDKKRFYYDMAPGIGNKFDEYQFKDIWNDMFNICILLDDDLYKKLMVILYRMAYLVDFNIVDKKVRFSPPEEILCEIECIQKEIDRNKKNYNIIELLYFIDLLSWNEDMRYYKYESKRPGRINCIYGIIAVTAIYRDFYLSIINEDNKQINITDLFDLTQQFIHGRGMITCSDKFLLKLLEDELYN